MNLSNISSPHFGFIWLIVVRLNTIVSVSKRGIFQDPPSTVAITSQARWRLIRQIEWGSVADANVIIVVTIILTVATWAELWASIAAVIIVSVTIHLMISVRHLVANFDLGLVIV